MTSCMRTSRRIHLLAVSAFLAVAGVPLLRPQEPAPKRPPKVYGATSRSAPESKKTEVPITAGVAEEKFTGSDAQRDARFVAQRREFFASIGIVARYDEWLNPAPSTATFAATTGASTGVFEVRSRDVEADGSPRETAPPDELVDPVIDAIRTTPRAEEHLREGATAFFARDYPLAFDEYRKGSLLARESGLARHQFALAQFSVGDYEGAASSLRRAIELAPELPKLGLDFTKLYAPATPDLEDQRLALDSHVRVRPADRSAGLVLAWIAYSCGEIERARVLFESLLAVDPNDLAAHAFLAEIPVAR